MRKTAEVVIVGSLMAGLVAEAGLEWKNGDWQFSKDAKTWQTVAVPHDWAIAGPFNPEENGGSGKLPWRGVGHYKRSFALRDFAARRAAGEKFYLEFDGVMARPTVKVNGLVAGGWDYGYMSFWMDVTEFLREGTNRVAVTADTTHHNSRWYPGAGIYREVRFVSRPREHVVPGTLAITTPKVTKAAATVHVAYVSSVKGEVAYDFEVKDPRLWDVNDPYLYELELFGERFRYGIRTFAFTADDGFRLNGRRVQLNGVDLHSDMGPLGMAFDRDVMKRQLLIMKDMGVNALRTSHNAPDPKVLDLCDEMGIVVWDECFDKWSGTAGRLGDEDLDAYVARNLRQFVRRDRNHPSVVLWSIGNEIHGSKGWANEPRTDGQTRARCAAFRAAIRELDVTRPVGNGNCFANAIAEGCFEDLDVTGWNYNAGYRAIKAKYPKKPCVYSESASALSSYGHFELPPAPSKAVYDVAAREVGGYDHNAAPWSDIPDAEFERMETDRYCAGEFVWTGIDYLGEPTPYVHSKNQFPMMEPLAKRELARSSYFGIVDLMGIPKDRYWIYRAHWNRTSPTMHVVPHWNWAGAEGRNVPVYVYTDGDGGELFVNGKSYGRRRKGVVQRAENLAASGTASASSCEVKPGKENVAAKATDGQGDTRWCAQNDAKGEWWQIDLGVRRRFGTVYVNPESSDARYAWTIRVSDDGKTWREYAKKPMQLSQQNVTKVETARYLRITFDDLAPGAWASLREVFVGDCRPGEEFRVNPYYYVCDKYRLRWLDVAYEPGEVRAVAYKNGVKCGETVMRTAGKPVAVRLTDDPYNAPEAKTRFVQVDLVDAAGTRDPRAKDRVSFRIAGPGEIAAVGNGDARAHESFKAVSSHPLYYGKAVAVVRRKGPGKIVLTASVPGLKDGVIEMK